MEQTVVESNPRKLIMLLNKAFAGVKKLDQFKSFSILPDPNQSWAEQYRNVITNIIDLSTIERKINMFGYTFSHLKEDIKLLYENTRTFNGDDNELTTIAENMLAVVTNFINQNTAVSSFRDVW